MYKMDIKELEQVIKNKRIGLANTIWRLASLTRSPFVENFPETPEVACPELYPPKKTIPMPDFLKNKYMNRQYGKEKQ